MKKRKVWRYWCDHCGKGGCGGGAIAKHERHCCRNPSRICRVHKSEERPDAVLSPQRPIAELIAVFEAEGTGEERLARLRKLSDECPFCILSALLQSSALRRSRDEYQRDRDATTSDDLAAGYFSPKDELIDARDAFDFKKEKDAFWSFWNNERGDMGAMS
jgi:hypothetical protein